MKSTLLDMNHDFQCGLSVVTLSASYDGMSACCVAHNPCHRQNGTALVMSLVILTILTILGMASMSTSSLEVKMSGNAQATTQARSAAESGLDAMVNSITQLDPTTTVGPTLYNYGAGNASVSINFIESDPLGRGNDCGSGNSSQNFQVSNFDVASTGTTALGGRSTVHQGLCQVGAASN
jgi:hypothetical protein